MSMRARIARGARGAAPVVAGFAAGWGSWHFADSMGWISDGAKMKLRGASVFSQSFAQLLPFSLWSAKTQQQELVNGPPPSMSFAEILSQCGVPEQLEYLAEQLDEEIPYFFIGDAFGGFARLHECRAVRENSEMKREKNERYGDNADFVAPDVCLGLWRRMEEGVISFEIGCRCLAILAANAANARTLLQLWNSDVSTLLERTARSDEQQLSHAPRAVLQILISVTRREIALRPEWWARLFRTDTEGQWIEALPRHCRAELRRLCAKVLDGDAELGRNIAKPSDLTSGTSDFACDRLLLQLSDVAELRKWMTTIAQVDDHHCAS